jgi:hypothetical protein
MNMLSLWANYQNCLLEISATALFTQSRWYNYIDHTEWEELAAARVPIDAPRMGVPYAAGDILFILLPIQHPYTHGSIYIQWIDITRFQWTFMVCTYLHVFTARYSLMKLSYTPILGPI